MVFVLIFFLFKVSNVCVCRGGGEAEGGGGFSLNNSEMAVSMAFCSIQYLFIKEIRDKFGIPNLSQSPDIGQNSDVSIYDLQSSGQFLVNKNCNKSGTSNDMDMKLGPVNCTRETWKRQNCLRMMSCQQTSN